MLDGQRYSFTERIDSFGRSAIMPYLPLTLTLGDRSLEVTALLDNARNRNLVASYTRARYFSSPGNLEPMTNREQLIQELEQAPDDLVQIMLDFLHRVKATRKHHPLTKFAGILSDSEAEELQRIIAEDCRQVDLHEW